MELVEGYAKLRMNLLFTLAGKEKRTVLVTSAISGEGKSTIASNLAVSLGMSGKKILLVDADMRRACQSDVFHYSSHLPGLSDILVGNVPMADAILPAIRDNLDLLPAGSVPPNPCELLESPAMEKLLDVLLDVPPVNIVSDPLALSSRAAGALFVVRQHFSDHREIRRALTAAELTGLELLGFVFYGEKLHQGSYYSRKSYSGYKYYNKYDTRSRAGEEEKSIAAGGKENSEAAEMKRGAVHEEDRNLASDAAGGAADAVSANRRRGRNNA